MPIIDILTQPTTDSLNAAYRPIVFRITATRTDNTPRPPVVYCDIYFNNIFYKTMEKTQFTTIDSTSSDWIFDIQDAAQESLQKFIAANGNATFFNLATMFHKCYCKFRSSGFDSDGFTVTEDTAPVQGSGLNAPVSGTGTQTNTFYILNVALQHHSNQNLQAHLNWYKQNTKGSWDVNALPLTHRPLNYPINVYDSDFYPWFYKGTPTTTKILRIKYKIIGLEILKEAEIEIDYPINVGVHYLPAGTKNLMKFFSLNWTAIEGYYLELWDTTPKLILTTCYFQIKLQDEYLRVHFLNYLGTVDAANFIKPKITHEDSSEYFRKGLNIPLSKTDTGTERYNVQSNDTYDALRKTLENELEWLQQCKDSPKAYIEYNSVEGQEDALIPVVIQNGRMEKLKNQNEFEYDFNLQFKLSNDFQIIRN